MTNAETRTALEEYAKEDTQIAKDNGSMMITGTQNGVITLNCEDGLFQAWNNLGQQLTGQMNEARMIEWLTGKYTVA